MAGTHVINVDLADVWTGTGKDKELVRTLAWGDEVTVTKQTATHIEIELTDFDEKPDGSIVPKTTSGFIVPKKS
ncbi:MAG TPA: hypothetical protein VJS12_19775, partial [Steroidobacteraceae bacterium]|nr:hypothetical protein [Steroidobacteraceae bacterium]